MNRRDFATAAAMLMGAACASGRPAAADAEAVKQVIADYYDLFYRRLDKEKYRALLTDTAYAVYFLRSNMTDKKDGPQNREWLESAILRRAGTHWRVAVLHSTRIVKPALTSEQRS